MKTYIGLKYDIIFYCVREHFLLLKRTNDRQVERALLVMPIVGSWWYILHLAKIFRSGVETSQYWWYPTKINPSGIRSHDPDHHGHHMYRCISPNKYILQSIELLTSSLIQCSVYNIYHYVLVPKKILSQTLHLRALFII